MRYEDFLGRGDPSIRFGGVDYPNGEKGSDGMGEVPPVKENRLAEFGPLVREPQKTIEIHRAIDEAVVVEELKLIITRGTSDNTYRVTSGFVNGEMPTLFGLSLESEEPPEVTVSGTASFYLKCVGTFGSQSLDTHVVTVHIETSGFTPEGTDITGEGFVSYFYIGKVESGAIINQHGGGNLGVSSWGLYNLWWRA